MSIRVILADDHAVVRDGLRLILQSESDIAVVGDGADGRETVRLARELSPDVVVMDIAMPGLNGIDATQQLADRPPGVRGARPATAPAWRPRTRLDEHRPCFHAPDTAVPQADSRPQCQPLPLVPLFTPAPPAACCRAHAACC